MNCIPIPNDIKENDGVFEFSENISIVSDNNVNKKTVELLAHYIKEIADIAVSVVSVAAEGVPAINLSVMSSDESDLFENNDESYELNVTTTGISLTGKTNTGVVRGIQTLRQLIMNGLTDQKCSISCCDIKDAPCFKWRGLHLDVARHFFSVEEICKFIDILALHRMSMFHFHLTEDQGWRIEIKKYPLLAEVGSQRAASLIGHMHDHPHHYDDTPYGGFYTQEDIKKIVAFAADRHITIVPEIDMPGHMQAAVAAYPEWGCTNAKLDVMRHWGISQYILNAEESTVNVMKDILDEVMELFPGSYIHIGGDEALKTQWQESYRMQELMVERNLANEDELQSWFIGQLDKHISSKGRKLIGWDEILEGGLADDAAVMCWKDHDRGIKAAIMGHEVVMAYNPYTYFDYYQAEPIAEEPLAIGDMLSLDKVYAFDPIPKEIPEDKRCFIIGGQGQLWTEYMATMDHVMYMTYPRAAALAEVLWTEKENHNIMDFLKRLNLHRNIYSTLGVTAHPRP